LASPQGCSQKREVGYGAFVEAVAVVLEDRAGFRKDGVIVLTDKERDESKRNRNDNERADDCNGGPPVHVCV
jgi:hypothetical protein